MNIGGSGAAATMGAAYGSGTLSNKRIALFICAVAIFLGSLSGGEVVKTIGSGIVPTSILQTDLVVIVLAAATISLFAANMLGIPLSTSEITVGAVVGAGIAYQSLYVSKLMWIVSFWIITPFAAFFLAFFISKWIKGKTLKQNKWVGLLLIIAGFFEAFSAGMNNVANAVGPLVGAGLLSVQHGIIFGGLFVALGALLLGSRVLETNGKKLRPSLNLKGALFQESAQHSLSFRLFLAFPFRSHKLRHQPSSASAQQKVAFRFGKSKLSFKC